MFIESGKPNARLALAQNTDWLAAQLARTLWRDEETPATINAIAVTQVRETKKGVTLLYEVALHGAPQMYVGHLVPPERFAEEHASVLKKAKIPPAHGRTVIVVPEVDLILSAFPNDRKLKLISEDYLRAWLVQHLHEVAEEAPRARNWQVHALAIEVLRYVPERRFTARCRVRLHDEGGIEHEISFIAKQLTDAPKARRLFNHLRSLQRAWRNDSTLKRGSEDAQPHSRPSLRLPRAYAWEEGQAVVFIEDLPGQNLKQILFEIDHDAMLFNVGALLADFHRMQKRVRKRVTIKNELKENRKARSIIGKAFPHMRPLVRNILTQLSDLAGQVPATPEILLHGTYRLNHIFLREEELILLDLDSLRLGPPAYDLANFLASLYYLEAQERIAAALRQNLARRFLEGYFSRCTWTVSPLAVLWFCASLLLNKQTSKYVTHLHDDREEKARRMLSLADATLQLCRNLPEDVSGATLWKILP
ncbi:aminoglycoside phosphotransferase family protein [candidate division KSB1 bacterium]|nr:aminoglycoside phosphotransferase family protein [candidate division KSB1 bacterium]